MWLSTKIKCIENTCRLYCMFLCSMLSLWDWIRLIIIFYHRFQSKFIYAGKPAWKVQNTNERITCIGLMAMFSGRCKFIKYLSNRTYWKFERWEKYSVICVIKDHRIRRVMQCACNPSLFSTMFGRDFIIVSAIKICRSCALCLKEDVSWLWW